MKYQAIKVSGDNSIESILGLDKSKASHWLTHRWALGGLIATAILLIALILWGPGSGNTDTHFKTNAVTQRDITVLVTATGTVQPTNDVDISSELSGTIREVLVDYNDKVVIGQELAKLDTDKLKASVESAKAKLAAAKAKVKQADATLNEMKIDYNRKLILFEKKVYSGHDLEAAQASYKRSLAALESAKADVAAATADLKLNETNLAKTCICSPINGVVLKRDVEPGQTVASSLQAPVLFTIAEDLTKMEVQVDVDEADVGKVKERQNASFTVDAYPDKKFSAQIKALRFGSEVVQGVVTYKAILTTQNTDLYLRPGMTATAEIVVKQVKNALTIPNAALRYSPSPEETGADNRSFIQKLLPGPPSLRKASVNKSSGPDRVIWVLKEGEAVEVPVTIGASDGSHTEIIKGDLKPGQMVIIDKIATK